MQNLKYVHVHMDETCADTLAHMHSALFIESTHLSFLLGLQLTGYLLPTLLKR